MKKRLMSTLLMGAFFIASTSMFVSCKDYDDDINANTKAIQNVESSLKAQIAELNSALQQEKTAATAAHSQYADAIAKAQAAADAAKTDLAKAIADANSTHATKTELNEGLAPKASRDELNAAIEKLKGTLNDAINAGDNATAQNAQAALVAAIGRVNEALDGVKGDIATVTNAQAEIKTTLTNAIATVDKKANQTMVDAAVNALNTALAEVKQSAATKEAVTNAIDLAKGEIAKNVQAVEAAAAKAQADATSAQQDLAKLAEKVSTYAAAQAAAEAKIEQLQKAIAAANELEAKLQEAISGNSKDIATLRADLTQGVANLDAQIKSVNENLSKLIAANTNTIQDLAGTVGNIRLQINALENFCGNLEALNVPGIRDSMRLSFAQLKQAEQTARENLAAAEVRAAETAAGYVAALAQVMKDSIDAIKTQAEKQHGIYADQVDQAISDAKDFVIAYVDSYELDDLWDNVNDLNAEVYGEGGINDQLEFINNTLTWSATGKPINLEEVLLSLTGVAIRNGLAIDSLAEVGQGYDLWKADIDQFVADVKANKANYITVDAAHTYADNAVETAINALKLEDAETYVAKAGLQSMVTAFIADEQIIENLKGAGLALTADVKSWVKEEALADYLKTNDLADAIAALETYLPKDEVERIATKARTDARADAAEDTKKAIAEYDAALAASFEELFNQLEEAEEEAAGDDDAAAEEAAPTQAQKAISKLAELLKGSISLSEEAAEAVNVLKIQLDSKLTSLVFYPEYYYGGIEAIEITAMKIDETYKLKDASKEFTIYEEFKEQNPTTAGAYNVYPSGYAKYHVNPVNANLEDYTLSFIGHTAQTRGEVSYLNPVEPQASKNYRDENDVLWVEFENSAEIYSKINKATRIPGFAHNTGSFTYYDITLPSAPQNQYSDDVVPSGDGQGDVRPVVKEVDVNYATSHYVYGEGKTYGQGVVTALVAENAEEEDDEAAYVASDYALLVPVEISQLVLSSATQSGVNAIEYQKEDWVNTGYQCVEPTNFHLYTVALDRANRDNQKNIDHLMYNEEFDLTTLVETHYKTSLGKGASDQKVSDDLFRRLNLAYRFYPIDYTRGNHLTSESIFLTFTGKDELGYNNGVGYFNQVKEKSVEGKPVGEKIKGENPFGGEYLLANEACLGRQPIVRVELYRKDMPELVYAVGYLRLEISNEVEKPAESFSLNTTGNIYADCAAESCVETTWDQIQENLQLLRGGIGLAPDAWNEYELETIKFETESGKTFSVVAQYVDADNDAETLPVLIDKAYGYQKKIKVSDGVYTDDTSSEFYPYFYVGDFVKADDSSEQGIHTDIIKWCFDSEDYEAIYFNAQMLGLDKYIDLTTGQYKYPITRYVKLHHKDSKYPDLYVGITLNSLSLRFAAGTVGRVKNAYWKDAASNNEGFVDMVINAPLDQDVNSDVNTAAKNDEVTQDGRMYKNVLMSFFGEKIQIDLTNGLADITDKAEKAKAEAAFKGAKDVYANSKFYFRAPEAGRAAEEAAFPEVKADNYAGQWTVKGISGYKYTLQVTDLVPISGEYYQPYGTSISIVKVVDAAGKQVALPADAKVNLKGEKNQINGLKVLRVNDDLTDKANFSKVELFPWVAKSALTETDKLVKGYAQDMLNYASHLADGAKNNTANRPYNQQLTAFMILVADNGSLIYSDMFNYVTSAYENTTLASVGQVCYITPGLGQKSKEECFACGAIQVDQETLPDYGVFPYCYKPIVENNKFAVRFLRPVDIVGVDGSVTIQDAAMHQTIKKEITFSKWLKATDWAGYTQGDGKTAASFTNFNTYYDIKFTVDPKVLVDYYNSEESELRADIAAAWTALGYTGSNAPKIALATELESNVQNYVDAIRAKALVDKVAAATASYNFEKIEDTSDKWPAETEWPNDVAWEYTDGQDGPAYGGAITADDLVRLTAEKEGATKEQKKAWADMQAGYTWSSDEAYEVPEEPRVGMMLIKGTYKLNNVDRLQKQMKYPMPYTYASLKLTGNQTSLVTVTFNQGVGYAFVGNKVLVTEDGTSLDNTKAIPVADLKTVDSDPAADETTYPVQTEPKRSDYADGAAGNTAYLADMDKFYQYQYDKLAFDTYFGEPILNEDKDDEADDYDAQVDDLSPDYTGTPKNTLTETAKLHSYAYLDKEGKPSMTPVYGLKNGTYKQYTDAKDNYGKALQDYAANIATDEGKAYLAAKKLAMTYFYGLLGKTEIDAAGYGQDHSSATDDEIKNNRFVITQADADGKKLLAAGKTYENNDKVVELNEVLENQDAAKWYDNVITGALDTDHATTDTEKYAEATEDLAEALVAFDEFLADTRSNAAKAKDYLYSLLRTDLGTPWAERSNAAQGADVLALPTLKEAAPDDLDITFYDLTKDGVKFTYQNNRFNTNHTFRIYVPVQATYCYANEAPAAPIIAWGTINITSTKENVTPKQ